MNSKNKNRRISEWHGTLEIDHDRGVIYFHCRDEEQSQRLGTVTMLRICSLPKPIPRDEFIDVTHMFGVNYKTPKRSKK